MKKYEDKWVKVFHGVKTFEYDLALHEDNRSVMISALEELHPHIYKSLKKEVDEAITETEKAKTLFCGMFDRGKGKANVQKGRYAQVLAQTIEDNDSKIKVPEYLEKAIKHVCEF